MPLERVRVGCPTEIDGAAYYLAEQKGFFKDAGLDVTLVEYEPSKSMLTKAMAADGAWDIGIADAMEVIFGGKFGLKAIGISSDKSTGNQLLANSRGVNLWPPRSMSKEYPIVLNMNSTVEYAARACMRTHGFKLEEVNFVHKLPDDCVDAMRGNNPKANFGAFEFPHMYRLLENEVGSEVLCSAASAEEKVVGGIMVDSTFVERKPQVVTRVLAAWLRAIEFMKDDDNKAEVLRYIGSFLSRRGVDISRESLERHFLGTKLFGIDQQLELMKRHDSSSHNSNFDQWTAGIGSFMVEKGMRTDNPDPSHYIMDEFLQRIREDAKLYDFARGSRRPEYGIAVPEAALHEPKHFVGIFFGFIIAFASTFFVVKRFRPLSRLREATSRESHEYDLVCTLPGYIELADSHEIS